MLKRATYAVVASAATELAANLSVRGQHRARARKLRGPSPPQLEAALSDVNQLLLWSWSRARAGAVASTKAAQPSAKAAARLMPKAAPSESLVA